MYKITHIPVENTEPWLISIEERIKCLSESIKNGFKISVIIYQAPDTSTFRYRGYNIYQSMKNSDRWKVIYFYRKELCYVIPFFSSIDIITISRVHWTNELQNFIDMAKSECIPVLFDVDDRVFDLNYLSLVTNTLGVDFSVSSDIQYNFWFAYIARIGFTARQANAYIGTNKFLSKAFYEKFGKEGYIIPNFINNEQLRISERCCLEKKKQIKNRNFVIGYFSGTPSHINDFKIVYKQIMRLMDEYDDIILKVVGFMEFPREMQRYISEGRVVFTPLVDFLTLQELMAEVDVNIVPLVVNDFTNCKSELKFFEGAIVDTVTVASNSFTYKNCITNGVNGFLCNPTEWYITLKNIYLDKYDLKKIVENAHKYAIENYSGKKITKQIEDVYEHIIADFMKINKENE